VTDDAGGLPRRRYYPLVDRVHREMRHKLMTQSVYEGIIQKVWRGCDPYYGFPYRTAKPDLQGWGSQHRYLADTVATQRPNIIVEIGVWKGASCLELARAVQRGGLNSAVIAIDTWLGSWEHWLNDHWHGDLGFEFGYPTIYRTFLTNMILGGVKDVVIPLPIDSINAWHILKHFGIVPELVHIDGGHDFDAVLSDLTKWWSILTPGGTLIMDDYDEKGQMWQEVREATDTFLKQVHFTEFEAANNKCRFVKRIAETVVSTEDKATLVPE
jgi:Methyltransferase domain